jgi:ABC-type Fe3+/spermidine/putrescine transport system ATPase subunit
MARAKEQLIQNRETTQTNPEPPPAAASVIGLSKHFGKTSVLENISFDVAEGEVLVLLGASGSGKTTILRIIAGLEQPMKGKVILHGKDVTDLPARERGVGVIFQSYALFPKMNVEKNIGYGLRIRKRRRKEIRAAVDELVKLVQLEEHRKKYPSQLSGGQQQRVAIARTLAYKPEVLLFDEPFGALDTGTRSRLRRDIRALLKKVKVPSIFITHDQEEALELGDRIAVLNQGRIEQIGAPYEIYSHPATEYVASFLGAANVLEGVVRRDLVEVGAAHVEVTLDPAKFQQGDHVKIVFRPEDVVLSRRDLLLPGQTKISPALIEEIIFVGAFERIRLRLERNGGETIMATRLKPDSSGTRLHVGDRVTVAITSFTVLEPQRSTNDKKG